VSQERAALNASPIGTAIDCLRGGLAVMVLLAHAIGSAQARHSVSAGSSPWVALTLEHGGFWVQGFFVLSGFCIHQSLAKLRLQGNGWPRVYTLARISRLYPIFGISLVLAFMAWSTLGPFVPEQMQRGWLRWGGHFLMLQGITGSIHELGPACSLTYEAVYYAAWPLLLSACRWQVTRATCLGAAGSMLVAFAVAAVWKTAAGGSADSILVPLALIPAQFVVWVGGALLAHHWKWAKSKRLPGLGWVSALGLLAGYLAEGWLSQGQARAWHSLLVEYATIPFWLGLLVGMSHWQGAARWTKVAAVLGTLSYPLYVLHQLVLDVLVRSLPPMPNWGLETLLLFAAVLVMVLALGAPLESSISRWRAAWLRGRRVTSQPVALVKGPVT
jgi:peptidoglycan/LPS O-acetylase OafA/YrhL